MIQKPLESLQDILTVEEVAQLLRIGRNTAYECVRQGSIPSVRLGRRILIPRVALERILEGEGNGIS